LRHAFIWRHGGIHDLGTLSRDGVSRATGISNRGDVVGEATVAPMTIHPVLWRQGRIHDLGLPPGFFEGEALG